MSRSSGSSEPIRPPSTWVVAQVPAGTSVQALPWKSRVLVPAQVVALTGLGEVALARGDASAAEAALEAAVARSEELRQALPQSPLPIFELRVKFQVIKGEAEFRAALDAAAASGGN